MACTGARAYNALARQSFARLAQLPPSPFAVRFQAESLREQNKHAEAAAAWKQALPGLQRELAAALLAAKEYAEAQS